MSPMAVAYGYGSTEAARTYVIGRGMHQCAPADMRYKREAFDLGLTAVQGDVDHAYIQQRLFHDALAQFVHKVFHLRHRE